MPLLLAILGIAGTILRMQSADRADVLLRFLSRNLPQVSPEFERAVASLLHGLIDKSTGLLSVGTIFLVWLATRLVGTLRTVLREIFDAQQERSMIAGKIFDMKMVVAAGTLFALNVGLTVGLEIVARLGFQFLGLEGGRLRLIQFLYGNLVAFLTIWVMFLLIYRYLPKRRVRWHTALVAATFTATLFELMKQAFSLYVTNVADYHSTYGNLATLVILILWVYYSAVAFVLGGEVAQVIAIQRTRRRQKERLR